MKWKTKQQKGRKEEVEKKLWKKNRQRACKASLLGACGSR